jgi:uncharacterized membrane protein YgcG
MFRAACLTLIAVLFAGGLVVARAAPPEESFVHDGAGLFSPAAVEKADAAIAAMRRSEGQGLVVETFPTVPPDRARAVRSMSRKARADFFRQWAADRAGALKVEGVYLLICRSPAWTQTTLGPGVEDRIFPENERLHLEGLLAVRSTKRQYDAELLDAVKYVGAALYANRNGLPPPDSSGPWLEASAVVVGLLAAWAALALARNAVRFWKPWPAGEPATDAGAGTAFAGGLVGGLAGAYLVAWLGDRLRGRRAAGKETPPPRPDTAAPAPAADEGLVPAEPYRDDRADTLERRAEEY